MFLGKNFVGELKVIYSYWVMVDYIIWVYYLLEKYVIYMFEVLDI